MNQPVLESPEITQFRSSIPLQAALAEELKQPGIAAALAAIASTVLPRNIPPAIPGNHPDTAIAHQFYRMFGVQQVLSTLEAMTVPRGKHILEEVPTGLVPFAGSEHMDPRFRDPVPPKFAAPEQV
jgi:hypothetical protein